MPTPDFNGVRSLEITIWLVAATGTGGPSIFHLRSAPPQKRQVKMYKLVFFWWSAACHRLFPEIFGLPPKLIMGSKGWTFIYIVKGNFSKIVYFKGTIRKFLNMVAAHIEGLRHPHAYLTHFFHVNVPLIFYFFSWSSLKRAGKTGRKFIRATPIFFVFVNCSMNAFCLIILRLSFVWIDFCLAAV
jgi:hypothetical protein